MPDDFFTSVGQKVFWAWDAPRCNDGCIENWLGDGSCDQACNVSRCDWDAGECIGTFWPQRGCQTVEGSRSRLHSE